MAVKIIKKENGEVITKTSKEVKMDRIIRKAQKYFSVATAVAIILILSSISVFAETDNTKPANVQTGTMLSLMTVIWWVVRVAILIIGVVPALIKVVQGQADENFRDRNAGLTTIGICAAIFGATFALEALVSAQIS